jgi:hypothetical protein
MGLCVTVSHFHSFARIKFHVGQEVGFDAFDAGFDDGVQVGLIGEGTGTVFLGFEGFQFREGSQQAKDSGAMEPELGLKKPGGTDEDLGMVEEKGFGHGF